VSELVSVVIVGHDSWPDLELAIESALGQSHPAVEVIVVDNGSRDRTPTEVPRRYGGRVRYLRQANRGDGGGYNAGLAVARGDLLQFLDGDDFLAPNKLARQVELFQADPTLDVVYGDVRQFQLRAGQPTWVDWDTGDFDDMLLALVAPDTRSRGSVPGTSRSTSSTTTTGCARPGSAAASATRRARSPSTRAAPAR
jgi:glycosyltransferase involved in cell wall biosynthesis